MGFVSQIAAKLTGADVQADIAQRGANAQAEATRRAAESATKATQEAASQAARQQESQAARAAAQGAAADLLEKPMENPDVQLDDVSGVSASATAKKRRQSFGVGSAGTGVNI